MFNILKLARELIDPGIAKLRRSLADAISALVLLVVAALIGTLGLALLLYGGYQSLLPVMEPWMAGAAVAFTAIMVCLVILLLAQRRLANPGSSQSSSASGDEADDVAREIEEVKERGTRAGEELRRNVRPVDLALSAFIAGLVASKAFRERGRKERPPADRATRGNQEN
ncbi:hypothetical protein CWI75_08805 [Kineobactrum sediminis]|uniref:Uncharacterized protein n=1 Tax=Kineobactrum sediminis TaxID=1905677 RepID=A0A2N5Y2Q0_9GAMM|nr:hypothetical protein [Kineobactrum sediminis]PLW82673.1 hypothetical protein CWI75_08805 [Kineobactrum sediminis]